MMAQKQQTLATTARDAPSHRFTNLYSLLHWDSWMRCAAEAVLTRPGSSTAGVDGQTRQAFRDHFEEHIASLVAELKRRTYQPAPVRRVYIPNTTTTVVKIDPRPHHFASRNTAEWEADGRSSFGRDRLGYPPSACPYLVTPT